MRTFTPKYALGTKLVFADTPLVRAYRGESGTEVGGPAEIDRVDTGDARLTYHVVTPGQRFGIWVTEADLADPDPVYVFEIDSDGDVVVRTPEGAYVGHVSGSDPERSATMSEEDVKHYENGLRSAQRRRDGIRAGVEWLTEHRAAEAAKAAEPDPEVLALAKLFTGTDNPGKDALRRSQRAYDAGVRVPAPRPFEVGDRVRIHDDATFKLDGETSTATSGRGRTGRVTKPGNFDTQGNVTVEAEPFLSYCVSPEHLTLIAPASPF